VDDRKKRGRKEWSFIVSIPKNEKKKDIYFVLLLVQRGEKGKHPPGGRKGACVNISCFMKGCAPMLVCLWCLPERGKERGTLIP